MRLFLLRHARAELASDEEPDALRPLSVEGRLEAARAGRWLATRPEPPSLVLCSTARRAVETLDLVSAGLAVRPRRVTSDDLYLASAWRLFELVRGTDPGVRSQMLVGHNPGMAELAARLVGRAHGAPASALARGFPPATVVEIEVPGDDWRQLDLRCGVLVGHFLAAGSPP